MFNVFAIAAAVLALTAPFGGPPTTAEYKYTADHHGICCDPGVVDNLLQRTPAGRVALGHISVEPSGRSFRLDIDDFGTPDGLDVAVYVRGGGGEIFGGCVPVRNPTTITGTTPGKVIWIWIGERDWRFGCSGIATAGVVTIGGVKPLPK